MNKEKLHGFTSIELYDKEQGDCVFLYNKLTENKDSHVVYLGSYYHDEDGIGRFFQLDLTGRKEVYFEVEPTHFMELPSRDGIDD